MNPWDTKLTHELSEREMLDFIHHMEHQERFYRLEEVDQLVERCVQHWQRQRELKNSMPYIYGTRATTGWYGELDTIPEAPFSFGHKVVKIYPWMDEKHVRYLARMQIEEHMEG